MGHCVYCQDDTNGLRRVEHCQVCGRSNVDLVDEEACGPCRAWLEGDRQVTTDAHVIMGFYAAIVERARADIARPKGFATVCVCGGSVVDCSAEYLEALSRAVTDAQGDPSEVLHLVVHFAA